MPVSLSLWQVLGLILASALLWMHYVQWKDRQQPEPRRRLLITFVLGAGACGLSVLGFLLLESAGVPGIRLNDRAWTAAFCFLLIGPVEEGAKVLLAYLFVFRWREFDEPLDGFVYAAALSLGFASAENFITVPGLSWPQQLAHTITLPITHVLFSAIWGFGIGYARFRLPPSARRIGWQIGSVVLAMFVHGLYDFLLFAYQATLVTGGLALALWGFVLWRTHALAKQSLPGGFIPAADESFPSSRSDR